MKTSILDQFAADAISAPAVVTGGTGKGGGGSGKSHKSRKPKKSNKSRKSGHGCGCDCK